VDIRAGALQYGVGFFLYLKKEQDAFPTGEQKKHDTKCKKRHILFPEEEDKPNKETAGPDQESQDQPPE